MSKRIHLGQVPKNPKGQIAYHTITSVPVRIMVAEEELSQVERQIKRHHHPTDRYQCDLKQAEKRKAFLLERLSWWR